MVEIERDGSKKISIEFFNITGAIREYLRAKI